MNITKRGVKYRCEVCIDYQRQSKTFLTKAEAVSWGQEREKSGILPVHSFLDALERYAKTQTSQPRLSRLHGLMKSPLAPKKLEDISSVDISSYRDSRLQSVSPGSVRAELGLISAVLQVATDEWGWIHRNVSKTVRKPRPRPPRRRGISQSEIDQILLNLKSARHGDLISGMFVLALETGMRLGELLKLEWSDVFEKYVLLRKTKNGDSRTVSLSVTAREVLRFRPRPKPFPLTQHVASQMFRRYSINGVHFHDSRSEAITRLSKKLDVLQLAKMIGHRDLKSLMFYYAESPESIADRL